MTEFVVSSAMKRNWPSTNPRSARPGVSGPLGATVGGGGGGCPAVRPVGGGVGDAVAVVSLAP